MPSYNQHSLRFRTGDIQPLVCLFSAMLELKKSVRLIYNPEGILVHERVAFDQIMIMGQLDSRAFHEFKTTGSGVLCFNELEAVLLMQVLNQNSQRDEVVLEYDHKKKKQLVRVSMIQDQDGDSVSEMAYEIPIVDGDREIFEIDGETEIEFGVKIKADEFRNFVEFFKKMDENYANNFVSIAVMSERLEICKIDPSSVIPRAAMTLQVTGAKTPGNVRVVSEDAIIKEVSAAHLTKLMKLFQICIKGTSGDLWIYLANDKPVIFELQVGSLGTVSASVMPRIEDE